MRALAPALLLLLGCGPAHVFHKDPERGCPLDRPVILAAQEDIAAIAGCPRLGTLLIRTANALDLAPLARLEILEGDLHIGPTVGLATVALPRLRTIAGALRVTSNNDLGALQLPALEHAASVEISSNVELSILDLTQLDSAVARTVTANPKLPPPIE